MIDHYGRAKIQYFLRKNVSLYKTLRCSILCRIGDTRELLGEIEFVLNLPRKLKKRVGLDDKSKVAPTTLLRGCYCFPASPHRACPDSVFCLLYPDTTGLWQVHSLRHIGKSHQPGNTPKVKFPFYDTSRNSSAPKEQFQKRFLKPRHSNKLLNKFQSQSLIINIYV